MPWLLTIPEFVKKRACRYLLQHYLGQYLKTKIQLEDLTVDLYNGTGTITNVPLNAEAINEALEGTGAPVQVVSGYLGRVTISVPWSALMSDSCRVEVTGLMLSVMPCLTSVAGEDLATMTDSLFFGSHMTNSLQMAEEVMKGGPVEGEEGGGRDGAGAEREGRGAFEGMEALARAIETVLSQVQIDLKETVVQLVCHSSDYTHQYFVRLRVQSIKFCDEQRGGGGEESSVDKPSPEEDTAEPSGRAAVETKILKLSDISVEVGGVGEDIHTSTISPEDLPGVPVVHVSGEINVTVRVRGTESAPVPRVQVEAEVGGVHCLLAPSQLHILAEIASASLKRGGSTSSTFKQVDTGSNRPIPSGDLTGMQSQLRSHFREERRQRERRRDLLTADPYQGRSGGSVMTDSAITTSPDMFYSLNLHDSFSETTRSEVSGERSMESSLCTTTASVSTMSDSYTSSSTRMLHRRSPESVHTGTYSEEGDLDSITLGGGSGLQQLVQQQSPGTARRNRHTSGGKIDRGRGRIAPHDVCKYSLTLSGITVAVLQANPAYTHPTDWHRCRKTESSVQQQGYSSLDSSGLDPMCYLSEVANLLRGGVNRREVQKQREHLAQALPLDHLLMWFSTVKTGVSLQGSNTDLQLTVASCELWEFLYSNTANLPHITTPVSAALLVEVLEDISLSQPCIRLKLSHSTDHSSRKRHKQGSPSQALSVDLILTSPRLNLDPTLSERLQPLITSVSSSPSSRGRVGLAVSQAQLKHSLNMTTSNFHSIDLQRQAVFNQAMNSDLRNIPELRVHLKIATSSLSLSLRFPVPELSEAQRRLPWYHPSLRDEVLHINLSQLTLTSTLLPHLPQNSSVYDAYFSSAKVFLSSDGSVEGRELFLTISGGGQQSSLFGASNTTRASLQLVVQPVSDSILEQLNKLSPPSAAATHLHPHILEDLGLGLMEGEGTREEPHEPSPFSTKRDMYSGKSGAQSPEEEGGGPQEHTEQLVTPGTRSEMEEFEQYSSSLARYHLNLHLPRVFVHLPSKSFLQTLYCRFATDLALWRPASPEQVERVNAAKSLFFSSADIQPAATAEEKVQMCKSALRREYSEDEEEEDDLAREFFPSPPSASSCPFTPGLSLLSLSVSVDNTRLSMLLNINDNNKTGSMERENPSNHHTNQSPGESLYASALLDPPLLPDLDSTTSAVGGSEGEKRSGGEMDGAAGETGNKQDGGLAVVECSSLHVYLVSGYHGDPNHDYICAHVDQFSLAHTGSLQSAGLSPYSAVSNSSSHHETLSRLHHIVQRSPERLQLKPTTPCGALPSPMILVAMDIRLDPDRNSKTNKCAVALQNSLLNHYVTPSPLNCFTQLGEFLSLTDETMEGYEPPSLITEMHLHLQDLRLEYCPLHLPLRALLGVGSVQLSTSLVTGSPLLVVRLLVDHTNLALSDSLTHHPPPSLRDYVCVLDLDWFELTLRLCNKAQFEEESQKLFSHLPELSLECSSNVLQIHTCVDSCVALRDLLVYLASDGDLHPGPGEETQRDEGYSHLATGSVDTVTPTPSSSSSLHSTHPPSSASLDIDDLLTDAMEDSPKTTPTNTDNSVRSGRVLAVEHRKGLARESTKIKMQVVEHGEKSMDIDFGDSDEEVVREEEEQRGRRSSGGIIAKLTDAMEEEEEGGGSMRQGSVGSGGAEIREVLDDDEFCLLDAPTSTYVALGSKPVIKCLLSESETWRIVENHFAIPEHHVDQLLRPKHFPGSVLQYTLKELTIVWHLYGGHDFTPHPLTPSSPASPSPHLPHTTSTTPQPSSSRARTTQSPSVRGFSSPTQLGSRSSGTSVVGGKGRGRGGGGRRCGWNFSGGPGRDHTVHMEIEIDKMRLQYEVFPNDTEQASRHAFLIRDLEIRDRLVQSNINKFLYQYTTESMPRQSHTNMVSLKVLTTRPELETNLEEEEVSVRLAILPIRLNIDQDSFYFMFEFFSQLSDTSSLYHPPSPPVTVTSTAPTPSASSQGGRVFIHLFVFQPALPIKMDYTTKWRFPTDTMGTLPGILISLYHLDNSELTLKALNLKTGFLGWDSLLECVTREWSTDIMSRQLPLILKGVGPTHYITQFVHGVVDLVRLPYHQYQEDGRIVWGLQQGASSFSTSTGLAVVELTSRTLETLQSVAQMVYDLVTPVPEGHGAQGPSQRRAPHQPQDFREGVSNAYDVVASGLTGAAVDLYTVASQEHEERGVTGAVGGILRQIPGTVVKPVILLSEATRHVLGGVKNQFVPDARREAQEKWKTVDTND